MTKERMIEILTEVTKLSVGEIKQDLTEPDSIKNRYIINTSEALTAMQRVCEEYEADMRELERQRNEDALSALGELNHLRAELERLKQCEAIVRDLAQMSILDGDSEFVMLKYHARQWVRENTTK